MTKRIKAIRAAFIADESGATAIEYSLIVALVFIAILTSVNTFASNTQDMYSEISSAMRN